MIWPSTATVPFTSAATAKLRTRTPHKFRVSLAST
jgi:hypothetical protein